MTADAAVVRLIIASLSRPDIADGEFAEIFGAASPEDRHEAARELARTARERTTPVLSYTLMDVRQMVKQLVLTARAFGWLADTLAPTWASWPDRTLGDLLKREPPERIDRIRAELKIAGLDLDGEGSP